jgi:uncharacterized protein (TIGR02246 family)
VDPDTPEQVGRRLVRYLDEGDLDGLLALYEVDAVFAEVGEVSTGHTEIRRAHQRFLDAGLKLTLNDSVAFQVSDLALVHWSWTVTDAAGFEARGSSAEVLRRQADGRWKFAIDNSDGPALIGLP